MKPNFIITLAMSLLLVSGVSTLEARQRGGHAGSGATAGRAAPRGGTSAGTAVPRGQPPHGGAYPPYHGPGYGNSYYHYGYPYGYYRYGSPYGYYGYYPYGFGLSFSFGYGYPYGYAYGGYGLWPYTYYPYGYYGYAVPSYGGVQITGAGRDAEVYVDGYCVGVVDNSDGVFQQINLAPGPHHIEIRPKSGQPQAFDVNISPGQKVTYRAN
jgi:hypothetical protein